MGRVSVFEENSFTLATLQGRVSLPDVEMTVHHRSDLVEAIGRANLQAFQLGRQTLRPHSQTKKSRHSALTSSHDQRRKFCVAIPFK
eukprot:5846490-Amphidinium_carterae.1